MKHLHYIMFLALLALLSACSSTRCIPDGDQLYVGLDKTTYVAPERGEHYSDVVTEVDAALATAPNAALFGSSSIRSPFPIGLWIWNAFADSESAMGKWLLKSFGSRPVLMSWVNPELRASVASEVLRRHGYFRGHVGYKVRTLHNPKKARIAYNVDMGHLFTIDSLRYVNFPPEADSLIHATEKEAKIHAGDAFDISALDGERQRISSLFRNNGFYFYQPSYASYLADTVSNPGKVNLRFQMADSLPSVAKRKWYVGRVDLQLRKRFMEQLHDSIARRRITIHFNGKRPPIRSRVIMANMKLRPGQLYSYDAYQESANQLSSSGLFSSVDFHFTPRDTTGLSDTLDLALNCVFDEPYDFYITGNLTGKTNNRFGPGLVMGLTKRNAFRGGETLDLNVKGSYEWQTGHKAQGTSSRFNSYEYGFDASLELPRLVIPYARKFRRHRYYSPPSTTLKVSSDVINRAKYFKRHVVSGEWTYNLQPTATSRHQFSPLIFSYEYMVNTTSTFDSIVNANPYLYYTMQDQFVPKMQYVYTYTSPSSYLNPIWWQTTVSESGNLLSLGYVAAGNSWGEKGKKMFKNPYAQFFKIETELVKTWRFTAHSTLVGHVDVGAIWSYGNSTEAPYNEQFYVGGANSIRAFTVRSIGPGSYHDDASADMYYLDQTGDLKFLANLEYRPRLFGHLYGALFLDAGNVWSLHKDDRDGATFKLKNALKEMALGTGVGLRYDMDFLVIRLDWGIGLHVPYKSGFYNVGAFHNSQSIHFAIGYPF
jgi:outer membrane protein assembly factor BamA